MPLLPLFPLDLVLFPATPLPLHIFEPRYKELIRECLVEHRPFGVVRAKEDAVAEVGCTAKILEVIKQYEDGRMDITTEGGRRFEVVELNHDRAYLQAEVRFFDDESQEAASGEDRRRLLASHKELLALIGAKLAGEDPDDPLMSFHLVAPLPIDLDFKQTLLGMRSESERVSAILEYYAALIPRIMRSAKVREKAGGNGHV